MLVSWGQSCPVIPPPCDGTSKRGVVLGQPHLHHVVWSWGSPTLDWAGPTNSQPLLMELRDEEEYLQAQKNPLADDICWVCMQCRLGRAVKVGKRRRSSARRLMVPKSGHVADVVQHARCNASLGHLLHTTYSKASLILRTGATTLLTGRPA
jgi:hypothetical protein